VRDYRHFDEMDEDAILTSEPSESLADVEGKMLDLVEDEEGIEIRERINDHFERTKLALKAKYHDDPRIDQICERVKTAFSGIVDQIDNLTARVEELNENNLTARVEELNENANWQRQQIEHLREFLVDKELSNV